MKHLLFITLFLTSFSCSRFVELTDEGYSRSFKVKKDQGTKLLFSHNINGETHPCGCRNFPLGGIPQVNGIIKSAAKDSNTLYVDSGDTFFETKVIPEFILKSTTFTAYKIAEAFDLLGLNYFTPGDQDFALGKKFLIEIASKHKFDFLISNISTEFKIKHKKWDYIKVNSDHLFFMGITDPSLLEPKHQKLFTSPMEAIKTSLSEIEKKYPKIKNKKIVLISHSGMIKDKLLAKSFPKINWIIGSHSQSYLKEPKVVGQTKLVQVLSRNHHLGQIDFANKSSPYSLIEARDETVNLIKPNPLSQWLIKYKNELNIIQKEEQGEGSFADASQRVPTSTTCLECHTEQVEFWQGTSHSLAFLTLQKAKAQNNTQCIGCHSLGFKAPEGFSHADNIVESGKEKFNLDKYWKELEVKINSSKSIREMKSSERLAHSKVWQKHDEAHEVEHRNANVQCLHCHAQNFDHPFDTDEKPKEAYLNKCITCHTPDQSPEWYAKNAPKAGKDLATFINKTYFSKKLKAVSCPKIEKD